MTKKTFGVVTLLMLLVSSSTIAQEKKISGWAMSMNSIQVSPKIIFLFDAHLRSSHQFEKTETVILRPILGYMINKKTSLGLGVASISNWKSIDDVRDRIDEFRIWQQFNTTKNYVASTLQHRLRLEERWLPVASVEHGEFKNEGDQVSCRLRYSTRLLMPLKKNPQFSKGIFWSVQNEFFFNITGAVHVNNKFFDQSRTYSGIGYRLSKIADLELGYLYQYVEGRSKSYTSNHIVQVSSFLRL